MKTTTNFFRFFLSLIFVLYTIPPSHTHSIFPGAHKSSRDYESQDNDCSKIIWQSNLIALYKVLLVLTVNQNGCGNFTSVQKAVDAVPSSSSSRVLIIVDSGIYREKVTIKKQNVIIEGKGYQDTSIEWDDTAKTTGTFNSYSVGIFSPNFVAYNISFKNTAPPPAKGDTGGQAVALRVSEDEAAFYGCGFYGYQDTLLDDRGKHYFKECLIQGSVDFIFGNGKSLYENCTINSVASPKNSFLDGDITGSITAQGRQSIEEDSGFSFVNANICGIGNVWLGRAWGPYSTVVFSQTTMTNIISPDGWNDWGNPQNDRTVFYGEYENSGPGAQKYSRVKYAKELDQSEAAKYTSIDYINGGQWLVHR